MIGDEEQSTTEIDSIALDGVEQDRFGESFESIPQERGDGYRSNLVISSIVFGSVVVLAFIVLLVVKARTKLRRRKCDVTSSSSDETIPVESNTSSSKLTRSVPTGVAKFTIDEDEEE